jgi:hypothetical protein
MVNVCAITGSNPPLHPVILSLIYFGMVFAAGFIFGVVRTLYVAPAIGDQAAELAEAPFMLVVIAFSAWFISRRNVGARSTMGVVGALAAMLVLISDLLVGVGLRHMTVAQVFYGRELVSGVVYYGLVAVFAVLPYVLWRYRGENVDGPTRGTNAG